MSDFFKGYMPTKDKACLYKYTGASAKNIRTYDEVKDLEEYAGILASDSILIDIDNMVSANKLLDIVDDFGVKCQVRETTKGMHFFFKKDSDIKCYTGTPLACGLKADIKSGSTNAIAILKFKGKDRPIVYDKLDSEDYDILPKWLMPVNSRTEWNKLTNGAGRNQALFNYILTLQSNDFTKDEARESIDILNSYVLGEPLSKDELDQVLRDDAFKKPTFTKGTTFLFDKFARYIKSNDHVIKLNGDMHVYKDGVYMPGSKFVEAKMIEYIPGLNKRKRSEVLSYLELLLIDNESKESRPTLIAFNNGVYDLNTDELLPFDPRYVITNKIPHNYNPSAKCELVDNVFKKLSCNDEEIKSLLEEAVGSIFYRSNTLGNGKVFMLTGEKDNGKSTFLDMVDQLAGTTNKSSLDLKELNHRFKTAQLSGKLVNVGDDIGDEFITDSSFFKKLATGNPLNVENKGGDPFDFTNKAKMFYSANDVPRIKDRSGAVQKRLIIIPFNANFSVLDEDYDPDIKYKLRSEEAQEYLVLLGIKGLKRVLANKRYTVSSVVQKELDLYELENNPLIAFFNELDVEEITDESTNDVYKKYAQYCMINELDPISRVAFGKSISKRFDLDTTVVRRGGNTVRVFTRKE